MVYKILSPLSHIPVISVKVKFYRLNITLLQSVCLMCLEIWNLKNKSAYLSPLKHLSFQRMQAMCTGWRTMLGCGYLKRI